jgi:hypothetical protein
MKLTLKLLTITYLLVITNSCLESSSNSNDTDILNSNFELVRINNEYSMELPSFMKASNDLNDEASLQYQNVFKETYVIVIDENKEEFKEVFVDLGDYNDSVSMVKNYKNVQLSFLEEAVSINSVTELESTVINGLPFEIVEVDAESEGVEVVYNIGYVDGKEKVYMIMTWTEKRRNEKNKALFQKIIKSFKVSNRSKGVKKEVS